MQSLFWFIFQRREVECPPKDGPWSAESHLPVPQYSASAFNNPIPPHEYRVELPFCYKPCKQMSLIYERMAISATRLIEDVVQVHQTNLYFPCEWPTSLSKHSFPSTVTVTEDKHLVSYRFKARSSDPRLETVPIRKYDCPILLLHFGQGRKPR